MGKISVFFRWSSSRSDIKEGKPKRIPPFLVSYAPIQCALTFRRFHGTFYYKIMYSYRNLFCALQRSTSHAHNRKWRIFNTWMKVNGFVETRMTWKFRSCSIRADKDIIKFCAHSIVQHFRRSIMWDQLPKHSNWLTDSARRTRPTIDLHYIIEVLLVFSFLLFSCSFSFTLSVSILACPPCNTTERSFIQPKLRSMSIHSSIHRTILVYAPCSIFHWLRCCVIVITVERIYEFAHCLRLNPQSISLMLAEIHSHFVAGCVHSTHMIPGRDRVDLGPAHYMQWEKNYHRNDTIFSAVSRVQATLGVYFMDSNLWFIVPKWPMWTQKGQQICHRHANNWRTGFRIHTQPVKLIDHSHNVIQISVHGHSEENALIFVFQRETYAAGAGCRTKYIKIIVTPTAYRGLINTEFCKHFLLWPMWMQLISKTFTHSRSLSCPRIRYCWWSFFHELRDCSSKL